MFQRFNRFSALSEDDIYGDFDDVVPYNKVNNDKWTSLKSDSHPLAYLVRKRFGDYYYGKLTIYEINALKERMIEAENNLENYISKVQKEKNALIKSISEQCLLCKSTSKCGEKLEEHLKVCDSVHKCKKDFVAYECQFKKNGRCSHYYEIKHLDEDLENIEYVIDDYRRKYLDLKVEYERELARKEDRLEEYEQQEDDDWDDWNFEFSQMV